MTQSTVEKFEQHPEADSARRSLVRTGGMAIVAALVFVAIAFLIADAATGGLWVTPMGGETPEETPLGVALFMTLMGGVVGTGLAFAARRFAHRPNTQGWCHATQLR
jgi:cation transporter-like permease